MKRVFKGMIFIDLSLQSMTLVKFRFAAYASLLEVRNTTTLKTIHFSDCICGYSIQLISIS